MLNVRSDKIVINWGIIDADNQLREKVVLNLSSIDEPNFQVLYNNEYLDLNRPLLFIPYQLEVIILGLVKNESSIAQRIEEVQSYFPNAIIIVLSDSYDMSFVRKCIECGALAYLLKDFDLSYLSCIILEVLAGGSFISPLLARKVFLGLQHREQILKMLTPREINVVQGLLNGLSYKLIANDYNISLDTVREHIKKIYKKLKINSKGELLSKMNCI